MIFQSRNTKGKINQSERLRNQTIYSDKIKVENGSLSIRFFSYFVFLSLGVLLGFILFQYLSIDGNRISKSFFEKKLESEEQKSRNEKDLKNKDIENLKNNLFNDQKKFQKLFESRLSIIDEKIINFDKVSTKFINDYNLLTKKNEKKIYSDLASINSKISDTNKKINNISLMYDRLNNIEIYLNNRIKYFSVITSIYKLRDSIKNNYDIDKSLINLKMDIESLNDINYLNLMSQLENQLNTGIKNRDELIFLFNDIEKSILEENILPINISKLESPVKYFSSLITIKKLKKSDAPLIENIFNRARILFYQNKLSEVVLELEKIPVKDNKKLNEWLEHCKKLIKVENLINIIANINFKTEGNN